MFKKPSIDQDKINKQNKQSNISEFKTGYENNKTMTENLYYLPISMEVSAEKTLMEKIEEKIG